MKKTILLVDDEAGIRTTLGILLNDMGYDVVTAENGIQGLEVFDRTHPPVVLTDIKMPGMEGVELLQAIKKKSPDTEVIMMSGHGDMDLAIKSLKYEATDFITKPVRDDAVEISLKRAFDRIDIRRQLREYTGNLEKLVAEKSQKLIEAERLLAVGQAVEGFSSAIMEMADDLNGALNYFNDLPCFVSLHDRDLKILAANRLYKERLGDRVGSKSWEIYGGKAAEPDGCPAALTFKAQKGQRSRETLKIGDKEIPAVVYTAPIRDRNGKVELVIEITADVAEVKRLQEELQFAREQFRTLFNEVPCYITVQDRNLRITESNRLFKEKFGEGIGEYCYKVYKHRSDRCHDCPVIRTFEEGRSYSCEAVVTAKNEEQYNVLIWTAPIRGRDGKIAQVMEMSTDITQIHKLRDQLSSLGLLIGSISHSIKGMLTGLDGGIYMFNSGLRKNDRKQMEEGWETVQLVIGRIREMILNILYYAKKRDLKWERVDVKSFINEVAATFEPKIRKEKIEFVRDFDPGLGDFEIDPGVVRAALMNIFENAVEACLEDRRKKDHIIIFRAKQTEEQIIFEAEDNGIGMDNDTKASLFTLFFSSKGSKGTGLGLFVSKQIIEQHGGRIKVESERGKGSCFRIVMPKKIPESLKHEAGAEGN